MIATLTGKVAAVGGESCILDVNGVGFQIYMPLTNLETLSRATENVKIHTHFHLREEGVSLYGFLSLEDKAIFERIINVSGIGPKTALAILSSLSGIQFSEAIEREDHRALTSVSGVGLKTAQRLVLELKGKLLKGVRSPENGAKGSGQAGTPVSDTVDALVALGYLQKEAVPTVETLVREFPDATTPELVRKALQLLGKKK